MDTAPETFYCPECGYDLRGQTVERCPECGFHYDAPALRALLAKRYLECFELFLDALPAVAGAIVVMLADLLIRPDPGSRGHFVLGLIGVGVAAHFAPVLLQRWVLGVPIIPFRDEVLACDDTVRRWLRAGIRVFVLVGYLAGACMTRVNTFVVWSLLFMGVVLLTRASSRRWQLSETDQLRVLPEEAIESLNRAHRASVALLVVASIAATIGL